MSVFKLAVLPAIPISTKPRKFEKLMRTLPSSTAASSASVAGVSISLSAKNHHHQCLLLTEPRRRGMMTCARLHVAAHIKALRIKCVNNRNIHYYLVGSPIFSQSGSGSGSGSGRGKPAARSAPPSSKESSSPSASPPPPPPRCSSSQNVAADLMSDNMGHESSTNDVAWYQKDVPSSPSLSSSSSSSSQRQRQRRPSKLLTLPTILTLGRVAAIPVFVGTYYVNSWWGTVATASIFIAAAITDWLDGYIARKMRLGTAFGAFLDPVADKLMVAATLVLLCSRPSEAAIFRDLPWLLPVPAILIIGREITMSAVREWAASQNSKLLEAVAVNNLGKWKTATQMIALTILLVTRDSSDGIFVSSGVALLYISAGLAVWSLVIYGMKIWKVLLR
ncbi:hypothetical protein Dimus_011408 [Dionaea muscipula]